LWMNCEEKSFGDNGIITTELQTIGRSTVK
jgi:hypothetical protein